MGETAEELKRDPMLTRSEEEWEALEDAIATVYAFKAGRTLSEEDIAALHLMDKRHREDEETATDAYHSGLEEGLRQRGGDELVQLEARVSKAIIERATERALRKFAEADRKALLARVERLEGALRRIADWCPATQEITLAHQMSAEAEEALSPNPEGRP